MIKNIILRLFAVLLLATAPLGSKADTSIRATYSSQKKVSAVLTFNSRLGTYDFAMVVATSYGGIGAGHCGFCESSADVTIGDTHFTIRQKDKGDCYSKSSSVEVSGLSKSEFTFRTLHENTEVQYGLPDEGTSGECKLVAYLRIKAKQSDLGHSIPLSITGTWWREGEVIGAEDLPVAVSMFLPVPTEAELCKELFTDSATINSCKVDVSGDSPRLLVSFNSKDGNWTERLGSYDIQDSKGNLVTSVGYEDLKSNALNPMVYLITPARIKAEEWKYTLAAPAGNWNSDLNYNDYGWQTGKAGFGQGTRGIGMVNTPWTTKDIWMRKTVKMNVMPEDIATMMADIHHDEDVELYINGVLALTASGYITSPKILNLTPEGRKAIRPGQDNLLAMHVRQSSGGQYIDLGLKYQDHSRYIAIPLGTGANELLPDYTGDMKFVHRYAPYGKPDQLVYSTLPVNVPVNAYPLPVSLDNVYNSTTRNITINWEIANAPEKKYEVRRKSLEDVMRVTVEREDAATGKFSVVKTTDTPYADGQRKYSMAYQVPLNEDAVYRVSLSRVFFSDDGSCELACKPVKTEQLSVNSRHYYAGNVKAVAEGAVDVITWSIDGGLWSSGTKCYLVRHDCESNHDTEIPLSQEKFLSKAYRDADVQNYRTYRYTIRMEPGGEYDKQVSNQTDDCAPYRPGEAVSMQTSQGEFADKIQLKWVARNYNRFIIESCRMDDGKNEYMPIQIVDANSGNTNFTYVDEMNLVGIIYNYHIICQNVNVKGDVMQSDTLQDFGFRKTSGDINGRIVFEDGSAVRNADVRLTAYDKVKQYSLNFGQKTEKAAYLLSDSIMTGAEVFTLQALVAARSAGDIISKPGVFALGVAEDSTMFMMRGRVNVNDSVKIRYGKWNQLTAVSTADSVRLYLNGRLSYECALASLDNDSASYRHPEQDKIPILLGEKFEGNITEIRLWSRGLSTKEIADNYNRFLTGSEEGLEAYYNMSFPCEGRFFDSSYHGIVYNRRHGVLGNTVSLDNECVPADSILTFAGRTDENGVYAVRNVLYYGNGTSYMIKPILSNHSFSPSSEIRFFSSTASSHTINFTDKSSFLVPVRIVYSGGEYPVEGVSFEIDGNAVMKENKLMTTDANGELTISVPIGVHKVQAVLKGHRFSQDGWLVDLDGNPLNYQNDMNVRTLGDSTRVLLIGRVAGGATQGDKAIGFGLSLNNLSANSTVRLVPVKQHAVNTSGRDLQFTYQHQALKIDSVKWDRRRQADAKAQFQNRNNNKNTVSWRENDIVVHVAEKTGEFHAWVLPERYTAHVTVPGQSDVDVNNIVGNNAVIDMTSTAMIHTSVTIKDSVYYKADSTYTVFATDETMNCHKWQAYTLRTKPVISAVQLNDDGEEMAFFGDSIIDNNYIIGKNDTIVVWNNPERAGYYFGKPVLNQGKDYTWRLRMSEDYTHAETGAIDHVACDNVVFTVNNRCAGNPLQLAGDSITGSATYLFNVGDPDLTMGSRSVSIQAVYGKSDNQTSVNWKAPFADLKTGAQEMFVTGQVTTGSDFITAGPDKVLFVLRDPPGTSSYSYLQEGVSWDETSKYTGKFQSDQEHSGQGGWGVATDNIIAFTKEFDGLQISLDGYETKFTEKYEGSNAKKRSWSTTRGFKTSSKPTYVEADGDLFVGYSTNIVFGRCDQLCLVDKATYKANPQKFPKTFTSTDANWILASRTIMSMGEQIKTMFDYAQKDIITQVIPRLDSLRNSMFTELVDGDFEKTKHLLEEKVAQPGNEAKLYHISKVPPTSKDYAQPDTYEFIYNAKYWAEKHNVGKVEKDGKEGTLFYAPDSVAILNQWKSCWEKEMAKNEEAKYKATKEVQNYSFSAGSGNIEYKESYTTNRSASHGFTINLTGAYVGGSKAEDKEYVYLGIETKTKISVGTEHGNTWSSSATREHTYGFVLQDEDVDDRFSVTVYREPDWDEKKEEYKYNTQGGEVDSSDIALKDQYHTFIFKKVGGTSATPYEGAQEIKYWKEHKGDFIDAATMRVDKPVLNIPNNMVEGVPMGDVAYIDIEMSNASESFTKRPYILQLVSSSVPDGLEVSIDGVPVKTKPVYRIDYGQTLWKTLAIRSGKAVNYDNVRLMLTANDDNPTIAEQVKSEASFSVHFVPGSSPVSITQPSGEWNYNTACLDTIYDGRKEHYMPVTITGYDINYPNFSHLALEIKRRGQGDDKWIAQRTWKKDELVQMGSTIIHKLVLDSYPDDDYELRAICVSDVNNVLYKRSSEIRPGVKDMVRPRTYGDPSPADGILTAGENIEITFNEPIAQGLVNKEYISVKGILNGNAAPEYTTFVSLDGIDSELQTELEHNLGGKPLTIEMQARFKSFPTDSSHVSLFAHGDGESSMEFGVDSKNRLQICFNDNIYTASKPCPNDQLQVGTWASLAMTYDPETQTAMGYLNGTPYVTARDVGQYSATGPVSIGKCENKDSKQAYWHGDIATLRVWQKVFDGNSIMEHTHRQLSGREQDLLACYNMDEGKGSVLQDATHGVNLVMKGNALWTLPEGRALEFNGQQQYAKVDASKSIMTNESDWTLQFWFCSEQGQKNATILSTGENAEGDSVAMENRFGIRLDTEGVLVYEASGNTVKIGRGYNDGAWHCLGITLSRTNGFIRFYVDGNMKTYQDADGFGGIQTNELTIGAKQTVSTKQMPAYSEYFTGKVDDIQLWNLFRSHRQMEQEYNQELTGSEEGLRGYWPFDYYRKWEQATELDTTMVNQADTTGLSTGRRYGAEFTKSCAPIKDAQVAADIPFDFVTSERGIMIMPTCKTSAIENRILTISVRKIQDLHGNTMMNPYTWTALVKQTFVDWAVYDEEISMSSESDYDGNLCIFNTSGIDCKYSITNQPVWMHIDGTEGVCKANGALYIPYHINKGMAIGNYNEVLLLNVEDQTPSSLYFTAKVRGKAPDWAPANPNAQYKTNVFGQLNFNGHYSKDTDDMLAAFLGNKCVGAAHTTYNYDLKMHYALLTINYDVADTQNLDKLEFRTYDASTGIVYSASPSETLKLENNAVYGSSVEPIIFTGTQEMILSYALKTGWNWVSLPLYNALLADKAKGFDCIEGNFSANDIFKSFDQGCKFTNGGQWNAPERFALNNETMYMVRVKKDVNMQLRGTAMNDGHQTISIAPRWNWISYTPLVNLSLLQALAGYEASEGDIIKNANEFAIYSRGFWVGSLKYMEPGCGYMLYNKSEKNKHLVYPSKHAVKIEITVPKSASYAPHTMGIVAEIEEMEPGDILVAHTAAGGNVEATPVKADGKTLQFLSLSEEEGTPVRFSIKRDDELICAINTATYSGNAVDGSVENPVRIIASEGGTMRAYPTPATSVLYIDYEQTADAQVSFAILDIQGRLIKTLPAVSAVMGQNTQQIDVSSLASGHYLVRKNCNNNSETVRFIKK